MQCDLQWPLPYNTTQLISRVKCRQSPPATTPLLKDKMAAAERAIVVVVVTVALCIGVIQGYDYTQYVVPCDHSMSSCVCPPTLNSVKVDVCVFSFLVDIFQTFTRFRIDPVSNKIAVPHGGRAWYINETTGDYEPFPDGRTVCDQISSSCTPPYCVDGYSFRTYYAINGRIPGPSLIVNYNQTVVVNVTNILDSESLSVHWHGINQHMSNWMDGVQHITQCGINSGTSFTYIFQADPPGTHWYHSHSGSQRNEGVYGALIVQNDVLIENEIKNKIGIDYQDSPETNTLLFQDWQNDDAADLLLLSTSNTHYYYTQHEAPDPNNYSIPEDTLTVDGTVIGPIHFWSGLINGRGHHHDVPYIKTRLSIFSVSPDSPYRFRLIGAQHVFAFMISFDEHRFKIFGKDGALVNPFSVDYLIIQPGERYDIILETKSLADVKNKNNFVIRAETLEVFAQSNDDGVLKLTRQNKAEAILHYDINEEPLSNEYSKIVSESVPTNSTCTTDQPCVVMNCPFKSFPDYYNLTCIHVNQLKLLNEILADDLPNINPDQTLFFNFGFEGIRGSSSVNARNNRLPSSPLALLNTTQLEQLKNTEFCQGVRDPSVCDNNIDTSLIPTDCICSNVWNTTLNNSIMLVLSAISNQRDTPTTTHSVHLHGHHFHIVDIQFGEYSSNGHLIADNNDIDCGGDKLCTTPRWREGHGYQLGKKGKIDNASPLGDTLTIPAGGYAVVYYQSNNPGYWYLHSQTELHHLPGMGVILAEGEIDQMTLPPKEMNLCGNFLWTVEDYYNKLRPNNNSNTDPDNHEPILVTVLSIIVIGLIIMIIVTLATILYKKWCVNGNRNVINAKSFKQLMEDVSDSTTTDVELDNIQ